MIETRDTHETKFWQLVDDAYGAWRAAEHECERMLREWFASCDDTEPIVYLAYRAALDREESCARALQHLLEATEYRGNLVRRDRVAAER